MIGLTHRLESSFGAVTVVHSLVNGQYPGALVRLSDDALRLS